MFITTMYPICITTQVLVNYNYDVETAALWYRKEYHRALKAHERKNKLV